MSNSNFFLGIDTSCYTTSIALIDGDNNILYDKKKVLDVDYNKIGLRQQDALFQHMKNLPYLLKEIDNNYFQKIKYISVSNKPRNIKDSYMPVFLQGVFLAESLGHSLNIPIKYFSHQEGHIAAGLIGNEVLLSKKFVAIHLSGGTNEILLVDSTKENLNIEIIGKTLDISFGQLLDRIGVYLGYQFPCGRDIDSLSLKGDDILVKVPLSLKDNIDINISGLENYFKNIIDLNEYKIEDISLLLMSTITAYLDIVMKEVKKMLNIDKFLLIGGVCESLFIRNYYKDKENVFFSLKNISNDNAVGLAYLSKIKKGHNN